MEMVRLIYASRATEVFKPTEIKSILSAARKNNSQSDITGLLCFTSRCFLQCLEGGRDKVNQTYLHIAQDKRHEDIQIISFEYIKEREFFGWNMGYLQDGPGMRELLTLHGGSETFNPYQLSPQAALNLMRDIRDDIRAAAETEEEE